VLFIVPCTRCLVSTPFIDAKVIDALVAKVISICNEKNNASFHYSCFFLFRYERKKGRESFSTSRSELLISRRKRLPPPIFRPSKIPAALFELLFEIPGERASAFPGRIFPTRAV
jgi:hypothetical protein